MFLINGLRPLHGKLNEGKLNEGKQVGEFMQKTVKFCDLRATFHFYSMYEEMGHNDVLWMCCIWKNMFPHSIESIHTVHNSHNKTIKY